MVVKGKVTIGSKKRNAEAAGLSHEAKLDAEVVDTSAAQEAGFIDKFDQLPQETEQDLEKKRLKREYQKKKLKKQRQSKKGFDIVREDIDLIKLSNDGDDTAVDITHHLGIQTAKRDEELKQVKKKSRLQRALLNDREDDVLVFMKAPQDDAAVLDETKSDKKSKKDKKKDHNTRSDSSTTLTKRQQQKENKKLKQKVSNKSMLNSEHQNQLALLSMVAGKQETWANTRIKKETAKIEHFSEKAEHRIEKKDRERKIKNLMLEQVRMKKSVEKRLAKENKDIKDEKH